MRTSPAVLPALCFGACLAWPQTLVPMRSYHHSGQGVTGAYEGWFPNPDGSFSLLFGYFNRNEKEELDIPIGALNRIEPGGPDQGQPDHFLTGRQWGVFTIRVPKDFGERKLSWTLTANGSTTVIPATLNPLWEIEPFRDANGNTPPVLRFEANGPPAQGPIAQMATLSATAGQPLALQVWVSDDARLIPGMKKPAVAPVVLTWSKFRGPGAVQFHNAQPPVVDGRATTQATFHLPGDYVLGVVANDWSGKGGRGFLCCWTTGLAKVSVKP